MSDKENYLSCSNYHQHSPSVLFQNLLNLPPEIFYLIILKLSECKGGLQSILSFRAASSVTRDWVEKLPEPLKKRLYKNAQINVPLKPESLKQFLAAPPNIPVTSLYLSKPRLITYSNIVREHFPFHFSAEAKVSWNEFVNFWSSRLQAVEIDSIMLTLSSLQLELLFSSCPYIHSINTNVSADNIITNRSSLITQLVIHDNRRISFDANTRAKFFEQILQAKSQLERLEIPIACASDLRSITKFIQATKHNSTLRMTLNVTMMIPNFDRELNDERRAFYDFARSVVSSKSTIMIAYLSDTLILDMEEHVGLGVTMAFFEKVIHMSGLFYFVDHNHQPRICKFPNIKRIDTIIPKSSELSLPNLSCPKSLQRLGIFGNREQLAIRQLPNWLKCLELNIPIWENPQQIVKSLILIDEHFCVLKKLKVSDVCVKNKMPLDNSNSNIYVNSFENLRSLQLDLNFEYEDSLECSRYILMNILKLNLSLGKLKLSSCFSIYNPMIFHSDCTRQITEGPLRNTLVHISFCKRTLGKIKFQDDNDRTTLVSLAESNLKNHRQDHAKTHTKCYCFHESE